MHVARLVFLLTIHLIFNPVKLEHWFPEMVEILQSGPLMDQELQKVLDWCMCFRLNAQYLGYAFIKVIFVASKQANCSY
jgi:hypothetical protein